MSIETGYRPRPHQRHIHNHLRRFNSLVCHRRFGKSVLCVNSLIDAALRCNKPDPRFGYIAPLFSQAKDIAWSYVKNYGLPIPSAQANESELRLDFPNGARVRLYGADNPDRLRGLYFDGVVLDEPADMRPRLWSEIIRPALSDRLGWATFIGTPKGKNDFWRIHSEAMKDDEWYAGVFRASETQIVAASELVAARKHMTEDQYEQEFECSFDAAITGAVYGKWISDIEKKGQIKASLPIIEGVPVNTAWDLGFDDATAIWFYQVIRDEIHIIDYYENSGFGIDHYCDELKKRGYKYGRHYAPHDAAYELQAAGGRSIVQQAFAEGVRLSVVPATSQQNGIEATRLTLKRCWFDGGKCELGLEGLRQYRFEFDEDKKVFKSKPLHNWASHSADACEIIAQVWRQPSDPTVAEKPRFLDQTTADELFWPPRAGRSHQRV